MLSLKLITININKEIMNVIRLWPKLYSIRGKIIRLSTQEK